MRKKIVAALTIAWCVFTLGCLTAYAAAFTGSVEDFEKEYKDYLYDANGDGKVNRLDYVVGIKSLLESVTGKTIDTVYFGVVSGLKSMSIDSITPEELLSIYSHQLYDRNLDGVIDEDDYLDPAGKVRADYYEVVKRLMQTHKSGAEYTEYLKQLDEENRKQEIDDLRKETEGISKEDAHSRIYSHMYADDRSTYVMSCGLDDVIIEYACAWYDNGHTLDAAIVYSNNLLEIAEYAIKRCENLKMTDSDTVQKVAKAGFDEYRDTGGGGDIGEAKTAIRFALGEQLINTEGENTKLDDIKAGGFDYYSADVNRQVNKLYEYMYPIGVAIMLVAWALGILKTGMTNSFSLADKYSVVNALLRLLIGVVVMCSLGEMLSLGMSASKTMCDKLYTVLQSGITSSVSFGLFGSFIKYSLMLNTIVLAILQGFAPLFAGFCVLEHKKPAMSFLREYCKCLLVPPVTIVFTVMATKMIDGFESSDMSYFAKVIGAMVLSIACISSAKKIVQSLLS